MVTMPDSKPQSAATLNYAADTATARDAQRARASARAILPVDRREFVRFPHLYRVLHACMIVSFLTLALTGLSLKFSYTSWAAKLSRLLGGFETAGYVHRFAAVVMFCTFTAHVIGLFKQKRRDKTTWKAILFGPNTLLPNKRDLHEFVATIKWFVGMGPRPQYGRWTYWEKFDYFAVFWGIVVIGSTGLTLWFPVFFTRFLPGPFINVATIIHSDEALLATGFIFTVHFFNTHLRPEKFPMDTTIFTGHMPLAELKRDKPREYAELVASGELEQHLEEPQPEIVVKTIRVFAWIALGTGFSVVIWILYAMLFAYR
jgi:cytochrome b subunit of formate dehydrogenase